MKPSEVYTYATREEIVEFLKAISKVWMPVGFRLPQAGEYFIGSNVNRQRCAVNGNDYFIVQAASGYTEYMMPRIIVQRREACQSSL